MTIITIHKAKTNLSRLVMQACKGEEIIISRGSEPLVRLVPIVDASGSRKPGALRGKVKVLPSFFDPLPDDELSPWE